MGKYPQFLTELSACHIIVRGMGGTIVSSFYLFNFLFSGKKYFGNEFKSKMKMQGCKNGLS